MLIGVQVVLDVGQRKLKKTEVLELKEMLLEQGLHLKKLISRGKSVDLTGKGGQVEVVNTPTTTLKNQEIGSIEETILVKRTLRSGQRVFFPGNVVVLGDVNPGAEVIAGGNVLIMGSMRGMVHAGALGSEDAVVAAFRLNPTQLRIANHITRPPEGQASKGNEPEIASIKSGKVIMRISNSDLNGRKGMKGKVIVVTSGKGGVGKTTTTANLGTALTMLGRRVVMVDTDIGLRNLDVVMGLENRIVFDIVDVVAGGIKLKQALIKDKRFEGLYLCRRPKPRKRLRCRLTK